MGKIYHYADDNTKAWDLIDRVGYFKAYQLPENQGKNPPYESAPVEYNAYPTGIMTDKIIQQIRSAKESDQPFFYNRILNLIYHLLLHKGIGFIRC